MDKETLKRQIVDEVQSEFETKLREIKRQKTHAEEELESASERWRTERRRLNSEIDRLESSLAEAKTPARRKDGDNKPAGVDPAEVARIQAAADEKLKKATAEWETERARLTTQISRLEGAVADAIERSSNPHRASQQAKEQFDARLATAAKERLELEQQVLRVQSAWDEDKKKLSGEIIRLRRLAPSSKALEAKENMEKLRGRVESYEETRIRELEGKLTQANNDLQKNQQNAATAREDIRKQYKSELEEANRERAKVEEQFAAATRQWQADRLNKAKTESPARDPETEKQLKEALHGKQLVEERLQQLQEETQKQQQDAVRATEETRRQYEPQLEEAKRERARVEEQLAAATRKWEADRLQLQQSLDKASAQATARSQDQALLNAASSDAETRRQYEAQLEAANLERAKVEEQLAAAVRQQEAEKQVVGIQLQEALHGKQAAEERLRQLQDDGVEQLRHAISEARENVTTEVVDQLRRQYDQKIQEMIEQKTQLTEQLQNASSLLETERARFKEAASDYSTAGAPPDSGQVQPTAIQAEVERVQQMIREIEDLIDNPATELSTVIRKNVEKAELDAYVKGVLFSVGRSSGI